MSYSAKQYTDVARILRTQVERARTGPNPELAHVTVPALKSVADDFAAYFAFDNDRFDRERFLESAGFQP